MRAAAFIRYQSGEGFGHVGWAFDYGAGRVNVGSVENHSGHFFSPSADMGFWTKFCDDPVREMQQCKYDDVRYLDVPSPDPVLAYRTVLWIKTRAYRAVFRNCEDDVYDVLRAYGIDRLTPPSWDWFPKVWFKRFRGKLAHVADFSWAASAGEQDGGAAEDPNELEPWQPTWRRPWHTHAISFFFGSLVGRPAN